MSGWFNLRAGAQGAGQGMMLGGPWGALAGGVLGGVLKGGLLNRDEYGQRDAVHSTSFGQAAKRGQQSAYNAPDQGMGAPSLRPQMPRQASAPQMPRMPPQPNAFQNSSATMGLSGGRTYGGKHLNRSGTVGPQMRTGYNASMWPGL